MEKRIFTIESEEDLKVLRAISEPIESVEEEQELITSLKEHFKEGNTSLGIAAPQLGINKMAFAMVNPLNIEQVTVCINPEIVKMYPNKVSIYNESCLSIPNGSCIVKRFRMLKVAYINEEGKRVKKLLKDIEAVIFQHELDHLYGVLMADKDMKVENESEEIINE